MACKTADAERLGHLDFVEKSFHIIPYLSFHLAELGVVKGNNAIEIKVKSDQIT